ncbi:uncharacterized protein LOC105429502 [Pogonomyrmex barbatus]|uniref:Uncharacterized protein LOC105429502 n=1 Tax=Pogonomyrmex barbatus TaxID=144034 RepID=A0A6I9WML5_9HYME|nr:uncharacterized protein LOC105429502 [Pogonomyrmex barbatus]
MDTREIDASRTATGAFKDLKISENSADSSLDDEKEEGKQRIRDDRSSGIARCLKVLFCCVKRESSVEEIEYDPDEYDYIVEKLVVRRVPLALFAIPADLMDRRRFGVTNHSSRSTFSSSFSRDAQNTAREMPHLVRIACDSATNKALLCKDKCQDPIDGSYQEKYSIRREGILSRFSALYPDLKSKSPLKDPLNFSQGGRLFTEDFSEISSSTRTDVSSRTTSSMAVSNDAPIRDDFICRKSTDSLFKFAKKTNDKSRAKKNDAVQDVSRKEQDKFIPKRIQKYVVLPFQVRRGSFDPAKSKAIIGDLGVDGKSLSYVDEFVKNKPSESTESTENVKNRDLGSNTAVRWRITIKRQRANAIPEHVVSEECFFFKPRFLEGKMQ